MNSSVAPASGQCRSRPERERQRKRSQQKKPLITFFRRRRDLSGQSEARCPWALGFKLQTAGSIVDLRSAKQKTFNFSAEFSRSLQFRRGIRGCCCLQYQLRVNPTFHISASLQIDSKLFLKVVFCSCTKLRSHLFQRTIQIGQLLLVSLAERIVRSHARHLRAQRCTTLADT